MPMHSQRSNETQKNERKQIPNWLNTSEKRHWTVPERRQQFTTDITLKSAGELAEKHVYRARAGLLENILSLGACNPPCTARGLDHAPVRWLRDGTTV